MSYSVSTPIIGPATGTLAEALGWLDIKACAETEYATELWRLCALVGIDPAVLFAQWAHETGDGSSGWWHYRKNPAGIGVTGDPDQDNESQVFTSGSNAARGHVAHMIAYTYQNLLWPSVISNFPNWTGDNGQTETYLGTRPLWAEDHRFYHAVQEIHGNVRILSDLTGKWATDPRYAEKIAAKASSIFRWGVTPQEVQPAVSNELRIILNPGHRNSTGGNDEERNMTPALAQSYFEAFTKAGYETVNLGDTNGGLDETCRRMAAMIASAPGKCVLLDLHYEGSPAPGVFCIVPDVTGLTTNAPVPQDPNDTWDGNGDDRLLAIQISARIAEETGLQLRRGIRFPGMMDESETGVGADGWRLATFAYTSPYRTKAVRLVVEHGNHTVQPDRSIIMQPDFTDKCAAAAVAAVNAVYGGETVPEKPQYATPLPITWKAGDLGWKKLGDVSVYCLEAEVEVVRATTPLAWADGDNSDGTKAPNAGPKLKQGERVKVIGSFVNLNEKGQTVRWLIRASDNARIIGSSCRPLLPFKQ